MRYPTDLSGEADYVTFGHVPYSARKGASGGGSIILYVPNDIPAVNNSQDWHAQAFEGPWGLAKLRAGQIALDAVESSEGRNISNIVDKFKSGMQEVGGLGAVAKQGAIGVVGKATAGSGNNLLAVTKGQIYNPNTELIYQGPSFRSFTFNYNFMPKNEGDAQAACAIIKEFKTWSSPKVVSGGRLEVPHVWTIKYNNQYLGKFKPAALTDINVDYNSGLAQHMTFPSGMPIITNVTLTFTEVEFVMRKDHQSGLVGY